MIEILPPGTKVILAGDPIFEGIIMQVKITPNDVTYLVEWWNERARCEGWMYEFEFNCNAPKSKVGFR